MDTKFAPAERISRAEIAALAERLRATGIPATLEAVPLGMIVLDSHRQIVFCNQSFRALARKQDQDSALGLRPGEALDCIHAREHDGGCGCAGPCRMCGAAQAILSCLSGQPDCKKCRMLRYEDGEAAPLDLEVFTRPLDLEGTPLVLVTCLDVSHELRLRHMERLFYHDAITLAGSMGNLAALLDLSPPDPEAAPMIADCSRRLLREVIFLRDLAAAEAGRLTPRPVTVSLREFLEGVSRAAGESCGKPGGLGLRLDCACESLETDPRLLSHVLRAMLVNALEASDPDDIRLSCVPCGGRVRISVENPVAIPLNIQKQLFKRYVSTKGPDRGLGAYVMRLFGEKILGGQVGFESARGLTRFWIEL